MSHVVRQLLGEFTGVGNVAPVTAVPLAPKKSLFRRRRRQKVREAETSIPDGAEKVLSSEPEPGSAASSGRRDIPRPADLIPTELALVAPDCTPRATEPLRRDQVPRSPANEPSKPSTASSILGLFTSTGRGQSGGVVATEPVAPVTDSMPSAPLSPGLTGLEEVIETTRGKPMPGHLGGMRSAAASLSRFNFNG